MRPIFKWILIMLAVTLACIIIDSKCNAEAVDENTPPEVAPRKELPRIKTPGPVIEKDILDKTGINTAAGSCPEYIEGKTVCMCKPKVITKKVCDQPPKIVEKTVDRVVEKIVKPELKHFRIALYAGQGPEGIERVIYKHRDGTREYQIYQNEGDLGAIEANYRINESWDVGAMYISNDTKLIGAGFSF